jgi:Na+/H+-dicarboxylate symporter
MKNNLAKLAVLGIAALAPLGAFAQTYYGSAGGAVNLLNTVGTLISTATPIVVGLAVLGFFWGLAVYIFSAGSDKKKKEGRNIMIYGILALFVMLSVFGIISMLQSTLNLSPNGGSIPIPSVNSTSVNGV